MYREGGWLGGGNRRRMQERFRQVARSSRKCCHRDFTTPCTPHFRARLQHHHVRVEGLKPSNHKLPPFSAVHNFFLLFFFPFFFPLFFLLLFLFFLLIFFFFFFIFLFLFLFFVFFHVTSANKEHVLGDDAIASEGGSPEGGDAGERRGL